MSFLARTLRATRAPRQLVKSQRCTAVAPFHNSSISRAFSEADHTHSKDDPTRDSKIESHKQDSVSRAKTGKGEWKPELASQSEQNVKGDKHDMSVEEMQKLGEQKAQEGKRPSGSSSSDKA